MKQLIKFVSAAAIAGVLAIISTGLSPKHVVAQVKSNVVPDLVRNVDEPGFNVYQTSQNTFMAVNTVAFTVDMPIPTGKIAVVEHVSVSGSLSLGAIPRGFLRCSNGSQEVNHSLVFTAQGSDTRLTTWAASQPIKCYATPATSTSAGLSVHVQTNAFQTLQPSWVAAVSGYTVPQ